MKAALMATMAILAAPLTAAAQNGPNMVEALVVNASTPGPAWWSVSKGDAKVWVLGLTSGGFRADDRWDMTVFERRLGKGGRLIHADSMPVVKMSPDDVSVGKPWFNRLEWDDRARFAEAMDITHVDPAEMIAMTPDAAASRMSYVAFPPGDAPKLKLMVRARVLDARISTVGESLEYPLRMSLKNASANDFTCLNRTTRSIIEPEIFRAKAQAWMRGDVRQLVLGDMNYDPCKVGQVKLAAARRNQDNALADAIAKALDEGQNAVALVDLVPLLRQEGVLDRLRSRGYVVRTPAQLDED